MQKRAVLNYLLLLMALTVLVSVALTDLFSIHSPLLSAIKSDSDDSVYLLFNQDVYQYHFSLAGWQFAYPTYLLPLLIINLLVGAFFSGFYVSVATTIIIALLFIVSSQWFINSIFNASIRSKLLTLAFVSLIMCLFLINTVMLKSIPIADYHGGTVLLSLLLIPFSLRYLEKPSLLSLLLLALFIVLSIVSDLLFVVSVLMPFAFALFVINISAREQTSVTPNFEPHHAKFLYMMALSTFIGSLCASYLRLQNYSFHSIMIISAASALMSVLLLPLLWMPKIIDWLKPVWIQIKIAGYIILALGLCALFFILHSQSIYHFVKVLFDQRIHFGIAGQPIDGYNFFHVMKIMLTDMLLGQPLSTTIWLKIYLAIPILSIVYLLANRYFSLKTIIPSNEGRLIAWFLLLSSLIVFFANLFSAGLNTFIIPKNAFNLRYFLIPIFLGTLFYGFILFHVLSHWIKSLAVMGSSLLLFFAVYPQLQDIDFHAYSNQRPYNAFMSTELRCLANYNKQYHFQYGLADHFAAEAANFYLPDSMYINQIVLNTGKIWHVMNNIAWYAYNPRTKQVPLYNFIITNQPWRKYPAITKRYGEPDRIIQCGGGVYLGVYFKPDSLRRLNNALFQQIK